MANQKSTQIPPWLSEVKEDATRTNEWTDLTKQIYDAVDQHMSQSHVSYFNDLSDAEKSLLLERAARSLSTSDNGKIYENLQSKLSYLLDQSVNNQVAKKLIEDNAYNTKTDHVLETTSEGIVTLLKKHPDQKYKLRVFLNQTIPQPIRFLAWQLYYSNSNYRKAFMTKLTQNPKLCLSPQDTEIQRRCENLLSLPLFSEIGAWRGYSNSLKGVLSYYHSTLIKGSSSSSSSLSATSRHRSSSSALSEPEYMFGVPIVYSHHPPHPKNDSPTERSMAMMVEMYMQFVETLPNAIRQAINGYADNPEMEMLVKNALNILGQYDSQLAEFFKELARRTSPSGLEEATYISYLKSACIPLISNLFSGYLNLSSLMFVWDQYTIGSDVPGYNDELIATITAVILMILRDQIMSLGSFSELSDCLRSQTGLIQTRQLQTLLNKYFTKSLQSKLNNSTRFGPVIDPTAGRLKPWEHWHQDIIPRRIIKPKEPDNTDERIQEKNEEKKEINRRLQAEKAAKEEIDRLRRELNNLRTRQPSDPPHSMPVTAREEPPTPRPRERTVTPVKQQTPPPVRPRTPQDPLASSRKSKSISENPSLDIFKRLKQSVNKLSNGEGESKKKLDAQTAEDLRLHKLDLRIAEKQVFGHQLAAGEWDALSSREKKARSEQMLDVVKKRLEKRYQETGKF